MIINDHINDPRVILDDHKSSQLLWRHTIAPACPSPPAPCGCAAATGAARLGDDFAAVRRALLRQGVKGTDSEPNGWWVSGLIHVVKTITSWWMLVG